MSESFLIKYAFFQHITFCVMSCIFGHINIKIKCTKHCKIPQKSKSQNSQRLCRMNCSAPACTQLTPNSHRGVAPKLCRSIGRPRRIILRLNFILLHFPRGTSVSMSYSRRYIFLTVCRNNMLTVKLTVFI